MKNRAVLLTDEEIIHTLVMLRLEGFREKKDFPKSIRRNRNDESKIMGRVMKKLRKALEE